MASQTPAEKAARGNDWSDAETVRAKAFRDNQVALSNHRVALVLKLKAPAAPLVALEAKTLPLADSSPPYIESP